jgi:hypothetical protein
MSHRLADKSQEALEINGTALTGKHQASGDPGTDRNSGYQVTSQAKHPGSSYGAPIRSRPGSLQANQIVKNVVHGRSLLRV